MKNLLFAFSLMIYCSVGLGQVVPAAIFPSALALPDTTVLPIRSFTVTQKENKAWLRWKSDTLPAAESFYAIERSHNGTDFNLVGITKNTAGGWFEFVDDFPSKGKIYYRIKLTAGQASFFSETVAATASIDAACKFYPNPVDKVLIVKSESGIELQISDRFGKALITDKFSGGLKVIDVSALEPGIYVITLFQKETNRMLTEKLVKK